jgi:cyclophilin family peptidyl-prolyl cis-trans isomerase
MESCSKDNIFKRYYTPQFVFTKPDYLFDEAYDNNELKKIYSAIAANNNKSPKKENRQPVNVTASNNTNSAFNNKVEKSKRGTWNFANSNQASNSSAFITRDDMVKGPEKRRKKSLEESKMVWTLPPK